MKHIGNLQFADGAKKKRKRIARGQGSGHGGTSTKGHKGQKSRAGATIPRGFEGGQMPLNRRVPKFGFNNRFRVEYHVVNVARLQELVDDNKIQDSVDNQTLLDLGVVRNANKPVKILGQGDLTAKLNVTVDKVSESAKQKIEAAGGTVTVNG